MSCAWLLTALLVLSRARPIPTLGIHEIAVPDQSLYSFAPKFDEPTGQCDVVLITVYGSMNLSGVAVFRVLLGPQLSLQAVADRKSTFNTCEQ